MSWFASKGSEKNISWTPLLEAAQVDSTISKENEMPALFFKHSTRCSISSMALNRFEKEWSGSANCQLLFLDLLKFRGLSDMISERTGVVHESPQAVVVYRGEVVYQASHNGIIASEIEKILKAL